MKQPTPGQQVKVTDPLDNVLVGTVIDLLSTQFTVWIASTDDTKGRLLFVFYKDGWSINNGN